MQTVFGIIILVFFLVVTTAPTLGVLVLLAWLTKKHIKTPIYKLYFLSIAMIIAVGLVSELELEGGILTAAFFLMFITPLFAIANFTGYFILKKSKLIMQIQHKKYGQCIQITQRNLTKRPIEFVY